MTIDQFLFYVYINGVNYINKGGSKYIKISLSKKPISLNCSILKNIAKPLTLDVSFIEEFRLLFISIDVPIKCKSEY